MALISLLCSGLEFWMGFGFGFVTNALMTAVRLEGKNIERLLPFFGSLPHLLQGLIRRAVDHLFGDLESKYIDKELANFVNIAWILAAVRSTIKVIKVFL